MPVQQSISCFENPPLDPEANVGGLLLPSDHRSRAHTDRTLRSPNKSLTLPEQVALVRAGAVFPKPKGKLPERPTDIARPPGRTNHPKRSRLKVPDPQELLESEINFR